MFKINRERRNKLRKIGILGIKNIDPRPGASPPGDTLVETDNNSSV